MNMNTKLKNCNGWILCPSKSFPGKFYYFNVLTGETAWSCEPDRRTLKPINENIHKITDRSHTYPEPDGPPGDYESPNLNRVGYNFTPKFHFASPLHRPSLHHNFGEANITQTPTFWNSMSLSTTPVFPKLKVDQAIQTRENSNIFATSWNIDSKFNSSFESMSKIEPQRLYKPSVASKLLFKEPVLKKQKTASSNANLLMFNQSLDNSLPLINEDVELKWENKVGLEEGALKSDDLRYRLEAKRKRCDDLFEYNNNTAPRLPQAPVKKKVTFNLGDAQDNFSSDSETDGHLTFGTFEESTKPTLLDVQDLRRLAAPTARSDFWYVLPDAEILGKRFDVLKKMVAIGAPTLRIYVPRCVFRTLAACTKGVLRGTQWGLSTSLEVQEPEPEMIVRNMSVVERMLNTCMFLMTRKYHAVILTTDPILYKRAKSLDLHCFYVDQISLTPQTRERQTNDIYQKLKKTIQNDQPKKNVAGNIFLQSPDKLSLFPNNDNYDQKLSMKQLSQDDDSSYSFCNEKNAKTELLSSIDTDSIEEKNKYRNLRPEKTNYFELDTKNFSKNHVFKPVSVEGSNWPVVTSETSNFHRQLSKVKEVKNISNRSVSNEVDDRGRMTDSDIMNKLRSFCVSSKVVEDRARRRVDEWICCLTQIMEDALSEVLVASASASPPALLAPWYLNEAVECIAQCVHNTLVVQIAGVLSSMLARNSYTTYGHIKSTIQTNDLLKIYGCSELLLQALQRSNPHCASLPASLASLSNLRRELSSLTPDPEPCDHLDNPATTLVGSDDGGDEKRKMFVKKPSDVLHYLTQHFPVWRGIDEHTALETTKQDWKVIRTLGKDLKHLKIIRNQPSIQKGETETNGDIKFIRKTNLIQSFENKLRIKEQFDMDALDYDEWSERNGTGNEVNGGMTQLTDDSCECLDGEVAVLFVKEFLVVLSSALKDVYDFVVSSVKTLNASDKAVEKVAVHSRANKLAIWVASVQELLESILSRESDSHGGLSHLLASSLSPTEADKRAALYRSAVSLCLDQSSLLATCLQELCTH